MTARDSEGTKLIYKYRKQTKRRKENEKKERSVDFVCGYHWPACSVLHQGPAGGQLMCQSGACVNAVPSFRHFRTRGDLPFFDESWQSGFHFIF